MKSIIEREMTFENNSDMEVTVKQKSNHDHLYKIHNEARFAQQSTSEQNF